MTPRHTALRCASPHDAHDAHHATPLINITDESDEGSVGVDRRSGDEDDEQGHDHSGAQDVG